MKKFYSLLLLPALLFSLSSHAAWDIWQSRVLVNNGADVYLAGNLNAFADASLDGYYLGRFVSGGTLTMKGGELRTYKNSGSNVCGTAATGCFYRVYRTCDTPGSFINVQFPYNCEWPGAGCGNGAGDQKWEYISGTANLLFGLTAPGTYVFEVYWQIEGNETGGCGQFKYDSNSSNNFKAYFELNVNDSFSDGNFTATPTWSGDGSAFTVAAKSDAAGLLGTEVTKTNTLRLNAPAVTGSEYLSTQIATWQSQQDWYFWTGRRAQAATNSNRSYIWLYANEATLESGTVDGYRILIGDDTGNDEIFLERVDNGVGTVIFATTGAITNGITDWGVTLKVTRSQSGVWKIWTSTLPTIAGAGATALSCPEALSTVAQTNSLNSLLTATDTNYTPGANSYIGVVAFHTTGVGTLVAQEFDNFRMVTYPPDTFVNFTSASATINENLGGGTYTLTVAIGNPSATVATTVDVVLTSGSAARVNGYSTQTLTFPAGSSSNQTIVLTVTDNNLCDDIGYLNFQLQNIAGGLNAFVSAPTDFTLTIIDDNMGYQTLISDDFEDGNINGWTPVSSGTWNASSSAAASGTYSLRHVFTGAAGQAHVYADVDNACLPGIMTTWRFNLKTYNREPSPANKFLVFLSANENNLWGSTVDGYAIGVNPILSGDPDLLTLWRVDNGVPTIAIVTTAIDWGITQYACPPVSPI